VLSFSVVLIFNTTENEHSHISEISAYSDMQTSRPSNTNVFTSCPHCIRPTNNDSMWTVHLQ